MRRSSTRTRTATTSSWYGRSCDLRSHSERSIGKPLLGGTGENVSELSTKRAPCAAPTAAQFSGGLLWLREAQGYAAVDPTDWSLRWRVDIGQRLAENVVSTGSGFLIGGDQGTLLRLDATGHVVERSSVSRRIAALRPAGPPGRPDELIIATRGALLALRIQADRAGEGHAP